MVKRESVKGEVLEMQCDICGMVFDSEEEMDEFICFDYTMGPKSQYPNRKITFDVCQDCMIDRFEEIFQYGAVTPEDEIQGSGDGVVEELTPNWEN